jgi:hypothetical protein
LTLNRNNKVEEFNKLNEVFSDRVKDISNKAEESIINVLQTVRGKEKK